MKKTLVVLFSFIFIAFIHGYSLGFDKTITSTAEKIEKAQGFYVAGEVAAVDTKSMSIIVRKNNKDDVAISINDYTMLMIHREHKTIFDIKVGDNVRVKYELVDSNNIAKSIRIE
jgi:Cu/Ag efflux protein CusF